MLLVDDHPVVREGLRSVLEKEADIAVVGEAADGLSAIEASSELGPDVVVMDISMPGMNGIEATRRIVEAAPNTAVLCLSLHADRTMIAAMLRAGASGYVLKSSAFDELVRGVRSVGGGSVHLGPEALDNAVGDYITQLREGRFHDHAELTGREIEVLQLIAEGCSTGDVAAQLSISKKTVASHREHIMNKLGVRSVAALTKYAIREGITSVEPDPAARA